MAEEEKKAENKEKPKAAAAAKPAKERSGGGSGWFVIAVAIAVITGALLAYFGMARPVQENRVSRQIAAQRTNEVNTAYLEITADYLRQAKVHAEAANFGLATEALKKALPYAQKAGQGRAGLLTAVQKALQSAEALQPDQLKADIDSALAMLPPSIAAPVAPSQPEAGPAATEYPAPAPAAPAVSPPAPSGAAPQTPAVPPAPSAAAPQPSTPTPFQPNPFPAAPQPQRPGTATGPRQSAPGSPSALPAPGTPAPGNM
jgi:hypothetical protein